MLLTPLDFPAHWLPPQALCQLLTRVRQYFDAAVAALQGQPDPAPAPPALKPGPELDKLLNCQLAGLGRRLGRASQRDVEAQLAELEAAAPGLPKTYLARHLRCPPSLAGSSCARARGCARSPAVLQRCQAWKTCF